MLFSSNCTWYFLNGTESHLTTLRSLNKLAWSTRAHKRSAQELRSDLGHERSLPAHSKRLPSKRFWFQTSVPKHDNELNSEPQWKQGDWQTAGIFHMNCQLCKEHYGLPWSAKLSQPGLATKQLRELSTWLSELWVLHRPCTTPVRTWRLKFAVRSSCSHAIICHQKMLRPASCNEDATSVNFKQFWTQPSYLFKTVLGFCHMTMTNLALGVLKANKPTSNNVSCLFSLLIRRP